MNSKSLSKHQHALLSEQDFILVCSLVDVRQYFLVPKPLNGDDLTIPFYCKTVIGRCLNNKNVFLESPRIPTRPYDFIRQPFKGECRS